MLSAVWCLMSAHFKVQSWYDSVLIVCVRVLSHTYCITNLRHLIVDPSSLCDLLPCPRVVMLPKSLHHLYLAQVLLPYHAQVLFMR